MKRKIVAMILAGGKGTRLEALTDKVAKPAVSFGGKYRIIDFPLSNCANSGINTVGILTQYEGVSLEEYIGDGEKWGLNGLHSKSAMLAPRQTGKGMSWYTGTANAIYGNLDFLTSLDPNYVLVLSGDHIYSTTYFEMIKTHIKKDADLTISVYQVPIEEASRFGILVADGEDNIVEFQEKPAYPTSNLASMGIYLFKWSVLRDALLEDQKNEKSSHDFGKDVIPMLLKQGKKLVAYKFEGYWKDVGTIASLHEANMDLLPSSKESLEGILGKNTIYSENVASEPQYIGKNADVVDSLINQGAIILGKVNHSVISSRVWVHEGAEVINSVVMSGATIEKGAKVFNAVVGPDAFIKANTVVGKRNGEIVLFTEKEEK